jgi:adenylate cyclase class 2
VEVEAKFHLASHYRLRQQILELGGRSLTARFLERNTRLDTSGHKLAGDRMLLRLRQGRKTTLTVKQGTDSFEARHEYEIEVDDYESALELLGALGYHKTVIYEKYREVYELNGVQVMLDEMPFGCFAEIESDDISRIQTAAGQLGLDWDDRIQQSYVAMFARLRELMQFEFVDATFSNFAAIEPVTAELLQQALTQEAQS